VLAPLQLNALAERVADVLEERRDDGFLSADAAADYLGVTRKAIYALVERGNLPHFKPAGRPLRPGGATGVGDRPMSAEDRICELDSSAVQPNVRLAGPLTSVQRIPFRARGDLL
jgi:excisionase family DNA binding protein